MGVGFAALNTGNNLLYLVFSFLLAFLVLSGVLSEAALRRIEVRRRLPREVFAESPVPVALEIENAQRRIPSYAIVVEDLAGADVLAGTPLGRVFVLRLGPGVRQQRAYLLRADARGPLRFAGFRVSTRFPFGLFAKSLLLEAPAETLVYPAIDALRAAALTAATRQVGEARSRQQGRGTEAAGLRAWVPGDSARSVHWRASARRGALLVRDREREEQPELEVLLRTRGRPADAAFELAVRHAASEVVAHLDAGFRVGLASDAERFRPDEGHVHRARILSYLARVAPTGDEAAA
ncbi:MAG TPA: DUF58 domain-containing protein [Myxococcota bacterium]|nr:DUF58 domain-containing protein [Myxococcota bacterium]